MNILSSFLKSNELIANNFTENGYNNYTILFIIIYLLAILSNGLWNTNFNINDILCGYGIIVGKNLVGHGIDSALNSQRGQMPVNQTQMSQEESKEEAKKIVNSVVNTMVDKVIENKLAKK